MSSAVIVIDGAQQQYTKIEKNLSQATLTLTSQWVNEVDAL